MKLLIIEGPDRCGKNTIISKLVNRSENYVVRHWGSAKGEDDLEMRGNQYKFFLKEFSLAKLRYQFDVQDNPRDLWIWNRAHLGEFVYGTMYRDTSPEEWVMKLEQMFQFDTDPSIYLLMLTAPAEFLCKRDDGRSFTDNVSLKQIEINRFKKAFDESKILNKLIIDVSNGEEYADKDVILHQVNNFLNF